MSDPTFYPPGQAETGWRNCSRHMSEEKLLSTLFKTPAKNCIGSHSFKSNKRCEYTDGRADGQAGRHSNGVYLVSISKVVYAEGHGSVIG